MANSARDSGAERGAGLSAFEGVFTPSMLTILGVIMYLRLGWVVGSVGLVSTLIIVTLASSITFLTALSIAEIATDRVVRVGGAYYMISRALGIETGGAVGLPLYFAQALSVALYTSGFAESLALAFPAVTPYQRPVALVTTLAVGALALKSARVAIRSQYIVMAAIGLSLASFILGGSVEEAAAPIWSGAPDSAGFWVVFAVFFPAVTGIMAGVNMSGDLRNPAAAIPRGTIAAVGVGYLVYMALPLLLAARAGAEELVADRLIMERMALWGPAILLGLWGATLSSAIGSVLGAPRVLQALARDGVLPRRLALLGRGSGPDDEPRIGTWVTMGVALAAVALGDIDVIAPVLTMFFLTTYMVLNLVAGIERFLDSPSFRPSFQVHWSISLLGAVGCLAVMFLINPLATVLAALLIVAVYLWLERRELSTAWGDVRRGLWMALLRAGLLQAERATDDPRNWRPHILVLAGSPKRRWHLIELASDLGHNRSLMTIASVLQEGAADVQRRTEMEETVQDFLERRGVHALVRIVEAEQRFDGIRRFVESYGLGHIAPNTVVMGTSDDEEQQAQYCHLIAALHEARRNVVVFSEGDGRGYGDHRYIDVWWGGLHRNGGLMMVLAYLLRSGVRWHHAKIRLKLVVDREDARAPALTNLRRKVAELRIGADPEVLVADGRPFADILRSSSRDASMVFLGMAEPGDDFVEYMRAARQRAASMAPTVFVLAAEDLAFGKVLLED